jgi:nickel/cobalt exporter
MSSAAPALLAAAAGVGFGHAILPDHWVPLAVVGRTQRYPLTRVARLSFLAGLAHVLVSLLLGAIIILVGLELRSTIQSAQNTIIGGVLILTGVGFTTLELRGGHRHGHEHRSSHVPGRDHIHADGHTHIHSPAESDVIVTAADGRVPGLAAIMVSFGAAASPDPTILPVFLAATAAGAAAAVASLMIFSVVTIGTIVGLTLIGCLAGYQVRAQWLERWANMFTASVLVAIGVLVFTGSM